MLMVLHHNNGYRVHTSFEGGVYSLSISTHAGKSRFRISSRKRSKIQKNVPHYIEFVNQLAKIRENGWEPLFDLDGKYMLFKNQTDNQEIKLSIRVFSHLSLRKYNQIKAFFPQLRPEEHKHRNDHNLLEIQLTASKIRKELFEEMLLQEEKIPVTEIINLVEKSKDPNQDLSSLGPKK